MTRLMLSLALILTFAVAVPQQSSQSGCPPDAAQEPENHAIVVERLRRYHDSGEYERQIRQVANDARDYLEARIRGAAKGEKLAAVFDIDETSISNWAPMVECGFCTYATQKKLYPNVDDSPAIVPVRELFQFAKSRGVAVFFLTGRSVSEQDATIKNLTAAGYSGWEKLIMRPAENREPARIYKPAARKDITDAGYRIILNIGDQASDLNGCCAERIFKLPNPFYLVN
ncbi:MAG: HAD family acid phosphatase [Acidobacteria bacterium]|nr:HAD family acid phosphatase [Acidobacteriota bacterium]